MDKKKAERLSKAAEDVENFVNSHPDDLSDNEHEELRSLLNERAAAMSEFFGVKIHSVCEDDD